MSPFEHGEVFVLDDGGETDLVRAVPLLLPSLAPILPLCLPPPTDKRVCVYMYAYMDVCR